VCRAALGVQRARRGTGLRILTETVTSPTLGAQLRAVLEQYPEARWHQWEPARADAVRAGTLAAFGDDVRPLHRLADADVIVALDADFLGCGPAHLAHVREFAARRRPGQAMNRLYVAESGLTPTGAKADHRLPVRAADVALLARALAAAAGVAGVSAPPADQIPARWVQPAAHYLESWGDVRAFDGTVTIVQPLIAPLYAGKSAHELLAVLAEGPARAGYDIVRARWQAERRAADFDDAWRSWLEAGVVPGT